jgi:segregation and condensation protein B
MSDPYDEHRPPEDDEAGPTDGADEPGAEPVELVDEPVEPESYDEAVEPVTAVEPDEPDDEVAPEPFEPEPFEPLDAEAPTLVAGIQLAAGIETDEAIDAIEAAERVRDASKRAIEALVMVAEEPLASNLLGQLLEVSPVVVDRLCEELALAYDEEGRGFQLVRVAGGWRYQSHPDQAVYVERFVLQGQTAKLSVAALETLAIVAYKQPVSRAQVASIRGVSVDGVMRTLEQRGYIAEIGKDPGPGQAVLFGTTPLFLEKLGLDNVDELPPLGDFVPGADVVEQLEQGLRPDRSVLRPEDAMRPGDMPPGSFPGGDGGLGGEGLDETGMGPSSTDFDLLEGMGEIAGISLEGAFDDSDADEPQDDDPEADEPQDDEPAGGGEADRGPADGT